MLLIFTPRSGPRLNYIALQLFKDWYNCEIDITNVKEAYLAYNGPKLNYSNERMLADEIRIPATSLLFESDIAAVTPTVIGKGGNTELYPFAPAHPKDWRFDILAASFWLLSRYEEYLPFQKDHHGRFEAAASLAYQHQFIELPLIQIWMTALLHKIQKQYPAFSFQPPAATATTTIDIDQAYAFLHRGAKQQILTAANSVRQLNFNRVKELFHVLKSKRDPYDTFEYLNNVAKKNQTSFLYFFLLASRRSKEDNNLFPYSMKMQELLRQTHSKHTTGIHPSYLTNQQPTLFAREIKQFQDITKVPPELSRQHYLILRFPVTYHHLIAQGIRHDYTMGYASHHGFRAATAIPFNWFDLTTNTRTSLIVHPFCYMDGTFKNYLNYSPETAMGIVDGLWHTITRYGGAFVHIWHNESVSDYQSWNGWREVFEHTLNTIHH